jgi:hypothetical protein
MSPNTNQPTEINVFVTNPKFLNLNENESEIDKVIETIPFTKTKLEEGKFVLDFSSENSSFKFWIGFNDVANVEELRQELTSK